MKHFAQLLNQLFFTYGNLDKMALIHRYLVENPDPERGYALAIMANTLEFPTFNRSLIRELIHEKIDPVLFDLSNDYVGDLAETLALLWPDSNQAETLPSLSEIILTFNTLPKSKMKFYLSNLLDKSTTTERWALLKLGLGSLRIGISARFIKKTLSQYGQVDLQQIEQIWHGLKPPYLELFAWLEKRANKPSLEESIFFHPVMLAHPLQENEVGLLNTNHFIYERKYDGIRIQIVSSPRGKALFSRTGDNISMSFPDILNVIDTSVILDGELVIIKDAEIRSFNELQKRLNRKSITKKLLLDLPAGVILYDILSLDQIDLRKMPFTERRKLLEQWFVHHSVPNLMLSELLSLSSQQSLHQLKKQTLEKNHPAVEGLMIKHKDSPYLAGRPKGYWYKWKKNPYLVDAVLMYAQRGHGKRSSYYSDYTFGVLDKEKFVPIGKAYFGFTDEELKELDKWIRNHTTQRFGSVREVEKMLVFEVSFDSINYSSRHKSGIALRFPRINRIRWDKPVEEIDHLETIINLIR